MEALKSMWIFLANISQCSFIIEGGIDDIGVALDFMRRKISWWTVSAETCEKEKEVWHPTCCRIFRMLGWVLYFDIAIDIGSESLVKVIFSIPRDVGIFKFSTILLKYLPTSWATVSASWTTPFSSNFILLEVRARFSENKGLISIFLKKFLIIWNIRRVKILKVRFLLIWNIRRVKILKVRFLLIWNIRRVKILKVRFLLIWNIRRVKILKVRFLLIWNIRRVKILKVRFLIIWNIRRVKILEVRFLLIWNIRRVKMLKVRFLIIWNIRRVKILKVRFLIIWNIRRVKIA